jgi:hypothetical protein
MRVPPAGYVEYRNTHYSFSFFSPIGTAVQDTNLGQDTHIFTLEEDANTGQGLQVFVVPYTHYSITEERFKKDMPSGVRKEVAPISVDGSTAVSFKGFNDRLGDTYEVWVIRGGYLYEISTLYQNKEWLTAFLKDWIFIK